MWSSSGSWSFRARCFLGVARVRILGSGDGTEEKVFNNAIPNITIAKI